MRTIFIVTEDALLVYEEQTDHSWQQETYLAGLPTYCLAVDPQVPGRFYCGTVGRGLWRSNEESGVWQQVGEGIHFPAVLSVAVSPIERIGKYSVVWAGTEPSALFCSEDGGETWKDCPALLDLPSKEALPWSFPPRPYTHHIRWIEPDPHDAARIFVAIEQGGVMRSLDRGVSWEDHKTGSQIDGHTLRTHKLAPGRVYEAAGGSGPVLRRDEHNRQFPVLTEGGYAETNDGGETWKTLTDGLEQHHYFWGLAIDPADPETILMSGALGPNQAHFGQAFAESFLYRRVGRTGWHRVSEGLPEPKGTGVYSLAVNEYEPGTFYAATGQGVYRSQDAGISWQQLGISIPEHYRWQRVYSVIVRGEK